jgi:LCP family protein required for cell wall assembly
LSSEWPPHSSSGYPNEPYAYAYDYEYHRRGVNVLGILGILFFVVFSLYLVLIPVSRLDHIFLPGNELNLGIVGEVAPVVETPEEKEAAETIEERINILFLGLDRRIDEAEDQPYRTDSVMVLTIDPFSKTAGAFSIPRDTRVEILDADGDYYTETRINTVYEYGEYPNQLNVPGLAGYPGGGAGLAMDTIDHNFGIQIDHYMVMDWVDFMEIINELGGVDINVPEFAYDPAYADCSFCGDVYPVEFVPGIEHMDGQRALAYARIRKSDNDYKRIERQQLVLKAMAAKAASISTIIDNPIGLYNKFKDAVVTDVSDFRAAGLGLLFRDVQNKANETGVEPIRTVSMAPATYPCPTSVCGYAAELLFDPAEVEVLKAQVFSNAQLVTESASVEVLNGTPIPELAATFEAYMTTQGIAADRVTVDEYANGLLYDTTIVIDRTGDNQNTLDEISEWLGLPPGRAITASDPQATPFLDSASDVIVILGQDVEVDWNTGQLTVGSTAAFGG